MKKILTTGFIFILLGYYLGTFVFDDIDLKKYKDEERYYFLQEGVYSNRDNLNNNLSNLTNKIVDYNNDKYYVYVGITKDLEVAEKIIRIYNKEGYNIYIKEKGLSNEEFSTNVNQFDLLIKDNDDSSQILTIEEVVLANYEEIIKKSSKN